MRKIFFKTLEDFAKKDKNIFLLVADLGIKFFESFKKVDEKRALNVGVAEANMIGVASGLSMSGKNVYCYSIIPFIITKALGQIKVDVAFNNLNVKMLGAGGGLVYGAEGITHHSIEDIAIMRAIPNMTVVCPGDAKEAEALAKESITYPSPLYIRFGRDFDPLIHKGEIDFKIGKGIVVNKGKDICIITMGTMLHGSTEAIELLKKEGVDPTLISMHTIKPLDEDLINKCAKDYDYIFTIEDHNTIGGLGSAVSEVLSENGYRGKFKRIGIDDKYCSVAGKTDYLMKINKLDPESLSKTILKEYKSN
ncbi:MAG: transketolase C-terminal domain-containing protein [Candidatus Nealsonbacteria bacterium]